MDFYKNIAHQLYCYNYKIDGLNYLSAIDFIETKHNEGKQKGVIFYKNLISAMPNGMRLGDTEIKQIYYKKYLESSMPNLYRKADTEKGETPTPYETPTFLEIILFETLTYCQEKIKEIEKPQDIPSHQTETTTGPPQQDFDKLKNSENQFLKSMPMEKVINHFKVLTEKNSKNGKPFLTPEQFILFLQKAFLQTQGMQKQKFNYADGEKGFIIKRFYEFYWNIGVGEYNEPNKKARYIKLVADNFSNWKEKTITPFFKPNKTKANW